MMSSRKMTVPNINPLMTCRNLTSILMLCISIALLFFGTAAFAQEVKFNQVINANLNPLGGINSIAQDRQGYIWFSAGGSSSSHGGLYRYDGLK
ncbi:MAG TPA: hypothetical protein VGG71_07815, partial [Chitinophagaceae bacterium]